MRRRKTTGNNPVISNRDFISLPYSHDLTQAGLAYSCKRFTLLGLPENKPPRTLIWHAIAEVATDLAFRRYLIQERIPFRSIQTKPFSDPDRQEIVIGERRCSIITSLISQKKQILKVRTAPHTLLKVPAAIPENHFEAHHLNDDDILIFTLLCGLLTLNRNSMLRALDAGNPIYQIHFLPPSWSQAAGWRSLGKLNCQGETEEPFTLEIGGLDCNRRYITENLIFHPGVENLIQQDYYSVHYLGTKECPNGPITITSSALRNTQCIYPTDWRNIWVYGMEIILLGYLICGDYQAQASVIPTDSKAFLYPQTDQRSLSLPIAVLSPLKDLFTRAKHWR